MKRRIRTLAASLLLLGAGFAATAKAQTSPGEQVYAAKCAACHGAASASTNSVGPSLRGVFGRHAGQAKAYLYSEGLKASNIVFDDATLSAWLTRPTDLVPKTKMAFAPPLTASEKTALIAFLKTLKP